MSYLPKSRLGDDATPPIICPDGQTPFNANTTGIGPVAWGCVNAAPTVELPSLLDPSKWSASGSVWGAKGSNTLLYVAGGAAVLWFLLRKKK